MALGFGAKARAVLVGPNNMDDWIWMSIAVLALGLPWLLTLRIFVRQSEFDKATRQDQQDRDAIRVWALQNFVHNNAMTDIRRDLDRRFDDIHSMLERVFDKLDVIRDKQ